MLPFARAIGEDVATIEAAVETDSSVEAVESLVEQDEVDLFLMAWIFHTLALLYVLTEGTAPTLSLGGAVTALLESAWPSAGPTRPLTSLRSGSDRR